MHNPFTIHRFFFKILLFLRHTYACRRILWLLHTNLPPSALSTFACTPSICPSFCKLLAYESLLPLQCSWSMCEGGRREEGGGRREEGKKKKEEERREELRREGGREGGREEEGRWGGWETKTAFTRHELYFVDQLWRCANWLEYDNSITNEIPPTEVTIATVTVAEQQVNRNLTLLLLQQKLDVQTLLQITAHLGRASNQINGFICLQCTLVTTPPSWWASSPHSQALWCRDRYYIYIICV